MYWFIVYIINSYIIKQPATNENITAFLRPLNGLKYSLLGRYKCFCKLKYFHIAWIVQAITFLRFRVKTSFMFAHICCCRFAFLCIMCRFYVQLYAKFLLLPQCFIVGYMFYLNFCPLT